MVHSLNPLTDPRWSALVDTHRRASIFHSVQWLEALRRTYGYEPVGLSTSSPSADLTNALVFCRINSWLTGRRLVSLPFADHCEPLVDDPQDRAILFSALQKLVDGSQARRATYVEIRPLQSAAWKTLGAVENDRFAFHTLDLRPSLEDIYANTSKDNFQRKVARAERERLVYETGSTESLLSSFYRMLLLTRKRHYLPPQPMRWFRNLAETMGSRLSVSVASKDGQPIAALLVLSWRKVMVYKYGASNAQYHNLGAVPFLFWNVIQDAKRRGLETLDLGRSDVDNVGLITFKKRLGATGSELSYLRYGAGQNGHEIRKRVSPMVRRWFMRMPDSVLVATGRLLYRHMG